MIPTIEVVPERFAGLYRFLEDGWRGWLLLSHEGDRQLVGRYRTDRYVKDFDVVAEVDEVVPHKVRITIPHFNEMSEQLFMGYLFRTGGNVVTGITYAEGTTFGFCARKTRSLILASYGAGEKVRPQDFTGVYTLHQEDESGVLRLEHDAGDELHGAYAPWNGTEVLPVTARIDETVRHGLRLYIKGGEAEDGRTFIGYLSTRPKNMVAGWIERAGVSLGCYMVRLSDDPTGGTFTVGR